MGRRSRRSSSSWPTRPALDFDVSMSARNAATLRGHFLNTANADWDLRGNIAKRKWDVVVLQEQSDAALPTGRGANANLPAVQRLRRQDREVRPRRRGGDLYRARDVHGDLRQRRHCVAAGGTQSSCGNTRRARCPPTRTRTPHAKVYLLQTWARPDMVFPHLATVADANYPTVPDGRPIVDTTATRRFRTASRTRCTTNRRAWPR